MIELGITQFFSVLLLGVAILAGLSVGWDRLRERSGARAARRRTVRCRICAAAYLREGELPIQSCPQCGNPNPIGRDRRLG